MIKDTKPKKNKKIKSNQKKKSSDEEDEKHLSKRKKTTVLQKKPNKNISLKEESSKKKNPSESSSKPIVRKSTIFNCGYKINLNNLSMNMVGYLSGFLGIADLFQFSRINRRLKIFVRKTSKMYLMFRKIKQYCKNQNISTLNSLIDSNSSFINSIQKEMPERDFTKQEMTHLITELLLSFCQGTELNLLTTPNKTLYFLTDLLTSDKCPFSSVIFNKIYDTKEVTEYLSTLFDLNKKIKKITISGFHFTKNDLTNVFSKLSLSNVIKDLSITPCYVTHNAHNAHNVIPNLNLNEINLKNMFLSLSLNKSITNLSLNLISHFFNENINESFLNFISKNKTIKNLSLTYELKPSNLNFDFLRLTDSIETLDLSGNILVTAGFKALERGLSLLPIRKMHASINRVKTLILKNIGLNYPNRAVELVRILNSNSNITKLDLSNNYNISNPSILLAFCNFMRTNTSLKSLVLNNACIGRSGLGIILEMLRINRTIEEIDLTGNNICGINNEEIVNVVRENLSISVFKFCVCQECFNSVNQILGPRLFKKIQEIDV